MPHTQPAGIGTPVGSAATEAQLDQPGPIELKTIGADWEADLSALLIRRHQIGALPSAIGKVVEAAARRALYVDLRPPDRRMLSTSSSVASEELASSRPA